MQQTCNELTVSKPSLPVAQTSAGRQARNARAGNNEVTLFDLQVANISMRNALDWICRRVHTRQKTLLNFVNAHCLNTSCKNADYRRVLKQSSRLLPDGSGVKLALRFQGIELQENLNGTDLFPQLCREAAKQGISLYLLGAGPDVAAQAARNMVKRYPQLKIAGTRDGYFNAAQEDEVIETINRSGADILLVAMGVPRQELWLARHLDKLNTKVNMGVGGLFDFYSERISRAPLWLRKTGMEWVWRLLQEPGRMWRRYIIGNPEFVMRAWFDARKIGRQRQPDAGLRQKHGIALGRRLYWWLSTRITPLTKRTLDIMGAGAGLLLASPLLILTALVIRLESPGSMFFSQERVGLRGKTFRFWKFRSMYIDAEKQKNTLMKQNEMDGGVLFKMKQDPRITRIGRIIRRFSIDELPQLWNVLRGEMSLVGPRPALPLEVAQYSLSDRQRLLATPGITGIWQVSGRSDTPFDRQVEMDKEYIHKATLGTDIQLLLKTVPAVIFGRGAY
ncbi:MAG: WecB/TagA/CpsF family glycosyltransferase [Gammaproteobacteria bacterium]